MPELPDQQTDNGYAAHRATERRAERALHVIVPDFAHRRARMAALESGLFFREYIIHLLSTAQPIDIGTGGHPRS